MDINVQEFQEEIMKELSFHPNVDVDEELLMLLRQLSSLAAACAIKLYNDKLDEDIDAQSFRDWVDRQ